jgi:hypothetical protein
MAYRIGLEGQRALRCFLSPRFDGQHPFGRSSRIRSGCDAEAAKRMALCSTCLLCGLGLASRGVWRFNFVDINFSVARYSGIGLGGELVEIQAGP